MSRNRVHGPETISLVPKLTLCRIEAGSIMAATPASTPGFVASTGRSKSVKRGPTIVEYGLAIAMFFTAVGAVDSAREQAPISPSSNCSAFGRGSEWLGKDTIAASPEACPAR